MKSFKLENFNSLNPSNRKTLRTLWKRYLQHDHWWHFFWEGEYTVVRCSEFFEEPVAKFLRDKDVKFTCEDWIDNIPITLKYEYQFKYLFHGFSELAMALGENYTQTEFFGVLDRVVHCFTNNFHSKKRYELLEPFLDSAPSIFWESFCLSYAALVRMYTHGRRQSRSSTVDGGSPPK